MDYIKRIRTKFQDPSNDGDVMLMLTHASIGMFLFTWAFILPPCAVTPFLAEAIVKCHQNPVHWSIINLFAAAWYWHTIICMKLVHKLCAYALSVVIGLVMSFMWFKVHYFGALGFLMVVWLIYMPLRMTSAMLRRAAYEHKKLTTENYNGRDA